MFLRWSLKNSTGDTASKDKFLDALAAEDNPKLKKMREMREAKEKESGKAKKPQEPPPILFPDLYWVWATYCFLSDRRGVGANGPLPITVEAMEAYLRMSNRYVSPYVEQVLRYVPALDREYLHDFYEKQRKEIEKQKRKAEKGGNRRTGQPSLGKRR